MHSPIMAENRAIFTGTRITKIDHSRNTRNYKLFKQPSNSLAGFLCTNYLAIGSKLVW